MQVLKRANIDDVTAKVLCKKQNETISPLAPRPRVPLPPEQTECAGVLLL